MRITSQDVKDFQRIYRSQTGQSLNNDMTYKKLQQLLLQMQLIYKPVTQDEIIELSIEIKNDRSSLRK